MADGSQVAVANPVGVVTASCGSQEAEDEQDRIRPTHRFPYLSLKVPRKASHASRVPGIPFRGAPSRRGVVRVLKFLVRPWLLRRRLIACWVEAPLLVGQRRLRLLGSAP